MWACGGVVGRSRVRPPVVSLGIFSVASDNPMCPVPIQPPKNEYQYTTGVKDGRCIRLTTYHFQVPMSRNLKALTSLEAYGPHRSVMGMLKEKPTNVPFLN
jgi:hypothetical protein